MVKNTTEYLQVGITPELKEKVNKYCSVTLYHVIPATSKLEEKQ